MTGALLSLGMGRLTLQQLVYLRDFPDPSNISKMCHIAPPQGLFLKKVHYPAKGKWSTN